MAFFASFAPLREMFPASRMSVVRSPSSQSPIFPQKLIQHHPTRRSHVERVLHPQHRDPHVRIGQRRNLRTHSIHLIAKYHAHGKARLPVKQIHRMHAGLDHGDLHLPRTQSSKPALRVVPTLPRYRQFRTQRRLVNLLMRRRSCNPRQKKLLDPRCIGRPEKRAHVIKRAHMIQKNRNRHGGQVIITLAGFSGPKWESVGS